MQLSYHCIGLSTLFDQLLFITVSPLALTAALLAYSYARHRSVLPYLPYALIFFFVIAPYCSSLGFRVLDECDCFERSDGAQECCTPALLASHYPLHYYPLHYLLRTTYFATYYLLSTTYSLLITND